jgi:transcriptional regulator with XRE-family HTH domain
VHPGPRARDPPPSQGQGLTLERLGEAAGLTPNYIGNIEAGQRDASLSSMSRIARAFGWPTGELSACLR